MLLTWLPDVLRDAGLDVVELDGWRTRCTRSGFDPIGVVWHHTATPKTASDATVDRLLRDGRSDLPGPLSQLGLRRSGTFVVVAAGRCNHNGFGTWGNDSIGIEAYNDGVGEPWPTAQVDAYVAGTAAICRHLGWTADRVKAHRETDPRRKVDPRGIDMTAARGRITAALTEEDSLDMDDNRLKELVREVLDEGTATGLTSWRDTSKHTLASIQANANRLNAILGRIPGDVDEAEVARLVLAGLDPAAIAEAVTAAGIAEAVADELAERLTTR